MHLTELEPQFIKREEPRRFRRVGTLAEADGVLFLCPQCFTANGGAPGTHGIICWAPSVPQDTFPTPGRWTMNGAGYVDLTLNPSIAILNDAGCAAHFFVRAGEIVGA